MNKNFLQKGSGLVEILVAVFIFSIILGSLVTASNMYLSGAGDSLKYAKGAYLAQEGIEAVKTIRDNNWNNISVLADNTDYFLYFDTSSSTNNIWKTTSISSFTDSFFLRRFRLNSVNRDSNGRIVSGGGTSDLNTKKITVYVSWPSKTGTTTKTLSTYVTNLFK